MKKFTGFYEDEESQKMMEIINRSANEEYTKRKVAYKKEKKQDFLLKLFIILTLLFMGYCVFKTANMKIGKDIQECVEKGEDRTTCENKFGR